MVVSEKPLMATVCTLGICVSERCKCSPQRQKPEDSNSWKRSSLPCEMFCGVTIYQLSQIINSEYKMGGSSFYFIYHVKPKSQ